jgi:hypothetical protein
MREAYIFPIFKDEKTLGGHHAFFLFEGWKNT